MQDSYIFLINRKYQINNNIRILFININLQQNDNIYNYYLLSDAKLIIYF